MDCWRSAWSSGVKQYEGFSHVGPLGWLPFPLRANSEAERQKMLAHTRWEYSNFKDFDFQITEEPDRAMRTLLSICRDCGTPVTLYLMPEGSGFQAVYPPHARERVAAYLHALRREYHFDFFDATGWMADAAFADSHHLLPEAADEFSERFAREIVAPSLDIIAAGGRLAHRPANVRRN